MFPSCTDVTYVKQRHMCTTQGLVVIVAPFSYPWRCRSVATEDSNTTQQISSLQDKILFHQPRFLCAIYMSLTLVVRRLAGALYILCKIRSAVKSVLVQCTAVLCRHGRTTTMCSYNHASSCAERQHKQPEIVVSYPLGVALLVSCLAILPASFGSALCIPRHHEISALTHLLQHCNKEPSSVLMMWQKPHAQL